VKLTFYSQNLLIGFTAPPCGLVSLRHLCVEKLLETNVCKFQSSQSDGSRAQLTDSLKTYSKARAFNCY